MGDFMWQGYRPQHPLDGPLIRSVGLLPSYPMLFVYDAKKLIAVHIDVLSEARGDVVVEDLMSHEITHALYS